VGGSPSVYRIAGGAITATLDLPFTADGGVGSYPLDPGTPVLGEASDGSIYVAGMWKAPADTDPFRWFLMSAPTVELGVVRIVGGAIDATFGQAHASSKLAWLPMTTERTVDTPIAVAVGPDGAPWVVGTGATTDTDGGKYTVRGPGVVLARFKP
jgi:hypothetical protein